MAILKKKSFTVGVRYSRGPFVGQNVGEYGLPITLQEPLASQAYNQALAYVSDRRYMAAFKNLVENRNTR